MDFDVKDLKKSSNVLYSCMMLQGRKGMRCNADNVFAADAILQPQSRFYVEKSTISFTTKAGTSFGIGLAHFKTFPALRYASLYSVAC